MNKKYSIKGEIQDEISKKLWKQCANEYELFNSIEYFKDKRLIDIKQNKKMIKKIKENYFEKITTKKINKFLNNK